MNIKTTILGLLFLCPGINAFSQTVVGDSCIVLTPSEARVLVKMTEDLKYTKKELEICDSVSVVKDQMIDLQKDINKRITTTSKKKAKKIGLISGGLGFVLGLILGLL